MSETNKNVVKEIGSYLLLLVIWTGIPTLMGVGEQVVTPLNVVLYTLLYLIYLVAYYGYQRRKGVATTP